MYISLPAAYLVSQLPSSGRFRAGFRSDDDYDDYSLDRDQEFDSLGFDDEEYDDYEVSCYLKKI